MKRQFWFLGRFALYVGVNLFFWPFVLRPFCWITNKAGKPVFQFVFLVYPGTADQVGGYIPLWARSLVPTISIAGVALGKHRGLVVGIPWTLEELEESANRHDYLERMVSQTRKLADTIGVNAVALAGRLPGILLQNGYGQSGLPFPLIAGDKGAVYTVITSAQQAIDTDLSRVKIGVVGGYGFVGSKVATALKECGADIVSVDHRAPSDNGRTASRDPASLTSCDVIVVLTARGDQAESIVSHLKPGTVVIDDTHPQLPRGLIRAIEKRGGRVCKAFLTLPNVRFWPRLPKWESDWLPGCCVEAIVLGVNSSEPFRDQKTFNLSADLLGFQAPAAKPKSEL